MKAASKAKIRVRCEIKKRNEPIDFIIIIYNNKDNNNYYLNIFIKIFNFVFYY